MNANCILLYGDDAFSLKKYLEQIFLTHGIKEEDIEVYDYEEDGIEVALTNAMTLPFLADIKGVVLRNCLFLSDKKNAGEEEIDALMRYTSYINPTTLLVLLAPYEKLDMRKKIVKYLTKSIESKAFLTKRSTQDVYASIRDEVERQGLSIDALALTQFVNRIGQDSQMLEKELDKLITYAMDKKRITSDMVYEIVTRDIDDNIYELVNAYLDKQYDRIMEIYADLKSIKVDPIWMLGTIASKFQEILYTKELIKMKYSHDDIAKYFNASKGRMYYIMQNARNTDQKTLMTMLDRAKTLDYQIKSGQIDKNIGMELFLLKPTDFE